MSERKIGWYAVMYLDGERAVACWDGSYFHIGSHSYNENYFRCVAENPIDLDNMLPTAQETREPGFYRVEAKDGIRIIAYFGDDCLWYRFGSTRVWEDIDFLVIDETRIEV